MRIIVHPGMPKAGSSSLQAFFQANASTFSAEGVCYFQPEAGRVSPPMLNQITAAVRTAKGESLVVSHESLCEPDWLDPEALVRALPDHQVEAVFVVRPLKDWMRSRERHRITRLRGSSVGRAPKARWFDSWIDAAPVAFADLRLGIPQAFLSAARLSMPEGAVVTPPANRSLPPRDLAIAINRSIAESPGDFRLDKRWEHLRRLLLNGQSHRGADSDPLDPQDRDEQLITVLRDYEDELSGRSLLRDAIAVVRGDQERTDWYISQFEAEVDLHVPVAEQALESWCRQRGRMDLAELMLVGSATTADWA